MTIVLRQSVDRPLTVDQFLKSLEPRPHNERWNLLDGQPVLMSPATHVHYRIATNLQRLLNEALAIGRPDLIAYQGSGVRAPRRDDFFAMPDVVVMAAEADYSVWSEDFVLAAEVRSPSNTARLIQTKLQRFQESPRNLYSLVIEQKRMLVDVYARETGWSRLTLSHPEKTLELPELGFSCPLREIYRGTPPFRARPRS